MRSLTSDSDSRFSPSQWPMGGVYEHDPYPIYIYIYIRDHPIKVGIMAINNYNEGV